MTGINRCPLCNGPARETEERVPVRIGQRAATVLATVLRCDACGETSLDAARAAAAQRAAANEIRRQEGLLSSDAVRAVRERLGLTQAQFEHLLGVGPKTVVRWESGAVFQQRSTDILLRLVDQVPGVADHLARLHDVTLPPAAGPQAATEAARPAADGPPPSYAGRTGAGTLGNARAPVAAAPAGRGTAASAQDGVFEIGPLLKRREQAHGTTVTVTPAQLQRTDASYPDTSIEAYGS